MELVCFGKYGPYPKAGCACSGYMLTAGGRHIVIDMGCGTLSKALGIIEIAQIDALVLSHLHADHMGDVLTLRYALEAAKKLGKRQAPLPVYLPEQPAAEAGLIASHGMIDARYISDGLTCSLFGIDVGFALMPHAVPSYAMSFCEGGKKFVYSGDTKYNDRLAAFAQNADLLLMEAAFLSRDKTDGAPHVSAKEAGQIGRAAGAKHMLITHIFPEYDEGELLREAQACYPGAEIIEEKKTYEV